MNNWQPIETAPKDGTPILIYEPFSEYIDEGIYIVEWRTERYVVRSSSYKCWVVQHTYQDEQGGEVTIDNPTHWIPLPEPPE